LRSEDRDLSCDFRKIRLATLGKCRESFARFGGLQTFAKQRASLEFTSYLLDRRAAE
jgi:hypothetical protein